MTIHDPQTRQTIVRLLSSMGSAKEISQYLKRFSQLDAARFAVVKVGGAVLRDDIEALTSSLAFLQDVGLTPIVIHGAGPQLDAELAAAGIEKRTVDGLQRLHQLQVMRMEHAAHDRQRFRRGHPQAVDGALLDSRRREFRIQLRTGAMDHDRGQADILQEGQR